MKLTRKEIDAIPGEDGWWKSSSGDDYWEAAKTLWALGVPETVIVETLSKLYWAAADCFGG